MATLSLSLSLSLHKRTIILVVQPARLMGNLDLMDPYLTSLNKLITFKNLIYHCLQCKDVDYETSGSTMS